MESQLAVPVPGIDGAVAKLGEKLGTKVAPGWPGNCPGEEAEVLSKPEVNFPHDEGGVGEEEVGSAGANHVAGRGGARLVGRAPATNGEFADEAGRRST